ncbi:MAG TPA: alpha/beta hydrolase [Candidatus Saccharimonadales bacterium]|nr:alpha/beta hydrolase [Candidatus Saccharimonadales bacterium]
MPDPRAIWKVNTVRRNPQDAKYIYGGDVVERPELVEGLGIDRHIDILHHTRQQMAAMTCGSLVLRSTMQRHRPKTLVMAGDDDPLMPFNNVCKAASIIRAELRRIPGGGHGFLLTRPKESADIINEFLDHDRPAPPKAA